MAMGLTKKQRELLTFIDEHQRANDGVIPSYDQMCEGIGLKFKSGVHRLILALDERGKISRLPNKARAIQLTDMPLTRAKEAWLQMSPCTRDIFMDWVQNNA